MTVREILKMAKEGLKDKNLMDLEVSDNWLDGLYLNIELADDSELIVRVMGENHFRPTKKTEIRIRNKEHIL